MNLQFLRRIEPILHVLLHVFFYSLYVVYVIFALILITSGDIAHIAYGVIMFFALEFGEILLRRKILSAYQFKRI